MQFSAGKGNIDYIQLRETDENGNLVKGSPKIVMTSEEFEKTVTGGKMPELHTRTDWQKKEGIESIKDGRVVKKAQKLAPKNGSIQHDPGGTQHKPAPAPTSDGPSRTIQ